MINIANTNTYKIKEIIEDLKQQDIDILVFLKDDVNPVNEIENNSYFISNFCLKDDQDISCFYIAENKLKIENNLIY